MFINLITYCFISLFFKFLIYSDGFYADIFLSLEQCPIRPFFVALRGIDCRLPALDYLHATAIPEWSRAIHQCKVLQAQICCLLHVERLGYQHVFDPSRVHEHVSGAASGNIRAGHGICCGGVPRAGGYPAGRG